MLADATILRHDSVLGPGAPGARPGYAAGADQASRCLVNTPSIERLSRLDQLSTGVRLQINVRKSALPAGERFAPTDRLLIRADGDTEGAWWEVRLTREFGWGNVANWELYCSPVAVHTPVVPAGGGGA